MLDVTRESVSADRGSQMEDLPVEAANTRICEHCGGQFEPRSRSGGKPQRFCSTDCRQIFHANARSNEKQEGSDDIDAQRSQRAPTCTTLGDTLEGEGHNEQAEAPAPVSEAFSWDDQSVILSEQLETLAYINPNGDLVIRQREWQPGDDQMVIISANNIGDFIDKLTDIIGIPSWGKPEP